MCGIMGYVGQREAAPLLFQGLKRLEYRGYDSAGIAAFTNGHISIRRAVGKLTAWRPLTPVTQFVVVKR